VTRRGDSQSALPHSLVLAAAWSWRLLLVGITAYAAVRVLDLLSLVVIPLVAAVLLAALLRPLTELLHRRLPGPPSALLTLLPPGMARAARSSIDPQLRREADLRFARLDVHARLFVP
jgi:hypothetical protein